MNISPKQYDFKILRVFPIHRCFHVKKQIFKLSEEGDLAKMSFFTIFYGNICYLYTKLSLASAGSHSNSAQRGADHTTT